jgi:hypothetical protein
MTLDRPRFGCWCALVRDSGMTGYFTDSEHWRRSLTAHVGRIFETPPDRRFEVFEVSSCSTALWPVDQGRVAEVHD